MVGFAELERNMIGSYRTYEEWKLFFRGVLVEFIKSSYRTYEEWKRLRETNKRTRADGSYRTYEEWKRTTPQ